MADETDKVYGVYAEYGQDLIPFDEPSLLITPQPPKPTKSR